jgi:pimeloyl-ACP methyl ester carboxylesterase
MRSLPGVRATRTDALSGVREIAEYFGSDRTIFGFTHLPAEEPEACVVICGGVYSAAFKNYRREVELARDLAAHGIAVQRFHYRGQGNSLGAEGDVTLDSMCDDAVMATERVVSLTGVERVGFFGATLGALVAGKLAARFDDVPIALWDPPVSGARYFRDAVRAQRMVAMSQGRAHATLADGKEGWIPLTGHSIPPKLYDSALGHTLEDDVGDLPRWVLLVLFGTRADAREMEKIIASWRTRGFVVDEKHIAEREAWWFSDGPDVQAEARDEATTKTVAWFRDAIRDTVNTR